MANIQHTNSNNRAYNKMIYKLSTWIGVSQLSMREYFWFRLTSLNKTNMNKLR